MAKRIAEPEEDAMTMRRPTLCNVCVHAEVDEEAMYCSAFPDRIPQEVMFGVLDHRNPIPGDGGIQFEPDPDRPTALLVRVYENMDRIAQRVAEEGE